MDLYESIISVLEDLSNVVYYKKECNLEIKFNPNMTIINACVKPDMSTKDKYIVELYSGCIIQERLIQKVINDFSIEDEEFLEGAKGFNVFEDFEGEIYSDEVNKYFASTILFHIYFHECGHLIAGHADKPLPHNETPDREKEPNFPEELRGSYEHQEREMVADHFGTIATISSLFFTKLDDAGGKMRQADIRWTLSSIAILYWISLVIEFQLFEDNHQKSMKSMLAKGYVKERDISDYSKRIHPIPSVRLFYCLEFIHDAVKYVYSHLENIGDVDTNTEATMCMVKLAVLPLIQKNETPLFDNIFSKDVVDYYLTLLNTPNKEGTIESDENISHLPLESNYSEILFDYWDIHS